MANVFPVKYILKTVRAAANMDEMIHTFDISSIDFICSDLAPYGRAHLINWNSISVEGFMKWRCMRCSSDFVKNKIFVGPFTNHAPF